jgi:hypothetical protein
MTDVWLLPIAPNGMPDQDNLSATVVPSGHGILYSNEQFNSVGAPLPINERNGVSDD